MDSANKLCGSVEPSEYKHVVLSLIFLMFARDKFIKRREELTAESKEAFLGKTYPIAIVVVEPIGHFGGIKIITK